MDNTSIFVRQIRARSQEHKKAMAVLHKERIISQEVAILRQELDSLVRVLFVLRSDDTMRERLIDQSVKGEKWTLPTPKGKTKNVTDREMVEFASTLEGWAFNVYSFGCSFIHLSKFHDHLNRDPFLSLDATEQETIKSYMKSYHYLPKDKLNSFDDIVPFFPAIFEKIASNLESYLKSLELGVNNL